MPRLTDTEWDAIQADYEANCRSFGELETKYGVNKSSISRRAAKYEWNQEQTQRLINEKVSNDVESLAITQRTQQLATPALRDAVALTAYDRLRFEISNNDDMAKVRSHVMSLLPETEDPTKVKAIMEVLRIQRESILGKSPDTAIQINNNQTPTTITRRILKDKD